MRALGRRLACLPATAGGAAAAGAPCPRAVRPECAAAPPRRRPFGTADPAAAEPGAGEVASSKRRLWRWGAGPGFLGKEEAPEVSREPALLEAGRGATSAACGSSHAAFVVDGQIYTYGSNKYLQLGRRAEKGAQPLVPEPVELLGAEGSGARAVQVVLGAYHSAAVTEDGALWTWGWGGSFWYGAGALGLGSRESVDVPTRVRRFAEAGEKVKQVACGAQHSLVLTAEGRLYSTGKGDFGRLGRGDTSDELEFEEIDYFLEARDSVFEPDRAAEIVKVDAGNNFSAAMSSSGELWVWGRNDHGQLGLGEEAMGDMYSAERYPRIVRSLPAERHRVVDFACGENHIVVVTDKGLLFEWGGRTWLEPHQVPLPSRHEESLKSISKVAAGERCSFVLSSDGTLYSWGSKASGCLAQGPDCPKVVVEPTPVPAAALGHQKVVEIYAGKSRCLAITVEDQYVP